MAPCPVSANPQAVCRRKRSPEHRLAERRIRQDIRGHLPTLLMWHVPPLLRSRGSAGGGGPVRSLRRRLVSEGVGWGVWVGSRWHGHARDRQRSWLVPAGRTARHPAVSRGNLGRSLLAVLSSAGPWGTPTGREGRDRTNPTEDPT